MRTLFQTIKQQFLEGNDLVLVSVTASSGSTPRGAGSRMLVGKNGRISGTIGGGAVEYRAECMALDILEKKESCEHEFRLNHKDVENIGRSVVVMLRPFSSILIITIRLLWKSRKLLKNSMKSEKISG